MATVLLVNCYPERDRHKVEFYTTLLAKFADEVLVVDYWRLDRGPLPAFGSAVLSGSPMMLARDAPPTALVRFVRSLDVPALGICFGHQLLARAFGAEVRDSGEALEKPERVRILAHDDLFRGLGAEIEVCESHREYVEPDSIAGQWEVLAVSDSCPVEAIRHREKPFFGVQFHPERSGSAGEKVVSNFLARAEELTLDSEKD